MATINGTSGNDILTGGLINTNDQLNGGAGDDTYEYFVGSGNDVVTDTSGNDVLELDGPEGVINWNFSRVGNDLLIDFYSQGSVTITNQFASGPVVETLAFPGGWGAFSFSNSLIGTSIGEVLVGTASGETIAGGGGDDLIFGNAGNDVMTGGEGDDELGGGDGDDSISGGAGDDWMLGGNGNNTLDGGDGWNGASYQDLSTGILANFSGYYVFDVANGQVSHGGYLDVVSNVQQVDGSSGNDDFYGGRTTGNGQWNAGEINFEGFAGNDVFHVGGGGEGAWASVNYWDSPAGIVVNLSSDSIDVNGVTVAAGSAKDGFGDTDTFVLGGDRLGITGSLFDDYIQTQDNAGGHVQGNAGNDTIVGGINSWVNVGYWAEDDHPSVGAIVNLSAAYITVGGVAVLAGQARDTFGDTDTLVNIRNVSGSQLDDYLVASDAGNGWLGGQGGGDSLVGGDGQDNLDGGDGDDILNGGAGNDWLNGGAGRDTAIFNGSKADFTVTKSISGDQALYTVVDNSTADGNEGTDYLQGVEYLQFSDGVIGRAVASDFNGDGESDILWRNSSTGVNTIWLSGDTTTKQAVAKISDLNWSAAGVGDFNGDGDADILWRNSSTGANTIWLSGDTTTKQAVAKISDLNWSAAGVGDFNGDGDADILWRNSSTGVNTIWLSGDTTTKQAVAKISNLDWQVAGTGDYNGDGKDDILWRNASSGADVIWNGGNTADRVPVAGVSDTNWHIPEQANTWLTADGAYPV
ncbi:MAG: VCBS repeat-containing protein [bacterium]|nr:VCBS repeat-containing protein [bacterium]